MLEELKARPSASVYVLYLSETHEMTVSAVRRPRYLIFPLFSLFTSLRRSTTITIIEVLIIFEFKIRSSNFGGINGENCFEMSILI